ncbi:16S rRNA (adenine(1518)-N(6)/adenine(1519)-N(6))-dimethyltransferase RsmA [Criibacterium bergeronii]|uniref:Ribosomal RNA small subunit methyltransferase A n=1 Tax=Criibacterium bergeronii TaxID=1871336 RepID=A0A552V6W4_9FIRM|nr:16S rRNA (adenine(1518)-N(6)/adenine(1519)-N(6))-dimethyltransferase RsmA [Criibacterium bergeronii]TRW26190.1 16S rRNA (adenine(1518)-N(6)/adenine(1519)-N(6))-dimethyltransferase RsmA [Criibacterium bergeronii]
MAELSSRNNVKRIIEKYKFRFSKSLGQNFLVDSAALDTIIDASDVNKDDVVLEIGTGIGTLTQRLCQNAKKVIAVEIDSSLIPILEETLEGYDNYEIINQDILKTDISKLLEQRNITQSIKVVANLPYYITTAIILKLLEENINLDLMVLMLQKEVADRLNAKKSTKDYGSLSIAVQFYCDTDIVDTIYKESFIPAPKVDSSVIRLTKRKEKKYIVKDEQLYFKLVRASFAKRRKTIINSILGYEDFTDKEKILKALELSELDPKIRGEALSLDEFARLADNYYDLNQK